ncbi:hypothetical protein V3C99_018759 [Haemonchus contortus]
MLSYVTKFWWHLIVLGLAVYVGIKYVSISQSKTAGSNLEGRKTKDVKEFILKEKRRLLETYCEESSSLCYTVEDHPVLENNELVVKRLLLYKDSDMFFVSTVELETPKVLTWENFNSRQWPVNKLVIHNVYTRLMIAMGFVMEALEFDSLEWQNTLMIGLGGGTQNNFLSAVDFIMVNLTTVELNPLMATMAADWFGLEESRTNNVLVEDGVDFLSRAAQRGEKFKLIILDACGDVSQTRICPANDFMKSGVIKNIARVLEDNGVLTVNIISSRDFAANEEDVLAAYEKHFTTCFLLRYSEVQRLLVCTQREGWNFDKQKKRFMENFRNVDDRFDFGLADIIYREN